MSLEVELKLSLPPRQAARLARHPLLAAGPAPARKTLHSLYFDTPDFALYRRGVALRLRRVGYHWVQTVKAEGQALGALASRPEWEAGVTGNQPDLTVLPPEARALVEEAARQGLVPTFVTEFRRTTWQVMLAGNQVEIALDRGEIRAGERSMPLCEVEFELKAGEPRALFELAGRLLDDLPFGVEPRSKAMRGYQLAGALALQPLKAAWPRFTARETAGEAWVAVASGALAQLTGNVPGLLTDPDPEYIHQARVAIRRLLALASLAPLAGLPRPVWLAELKWLMAELGPARDWDVLRLETLPRVRAGLPDPAPLDTLLEKLASAHLQARRRALAALASPRFTRLVLDMGHALLAPPGSDQTVAVWANQALERRYRRFRKLARQLDELDAEGRHRLRIAAKKLRYAGEAFASLRGGKARTFLAELAHLQDSLGAANDIAVTHRLLAVVERDASLRRAVCLAEGYLACEAHGHGQELPGRVRALLKVKPYWR